MIVSVPIRVEVEKRTLPRPPADPTRVVAVQWEEWFTPANAYWQTAQAVPLMGFYDSVAAGCSATASDLAQRVGRGLPDR